MRRVASDEEVQASTTLEIIPFSINAGEEKEIEVVLNNPDDAFTGIQFDLTLPEGIELAGDEDGYFIDPGSRTTNRKHTFEVDLRSNGDYRILTYSSKNSTFTGTEGDVIILTVKASETLVNGIYDLQMKNIVLSRPDLPEIDPTDYKGSIIAGTVSGNIAISGDITEEVVKTINASIGEDVTSLDLTGATNRFCVNLGDKYSPQSLTIYITINTLINIIKL